MVSPIQCTQHLPITYCSCFRFNDKPKRNRYNEILNSYIIFAKTTAVAFTDNQEQINIHLNKQRHTKGSDAIQKVNHSLKKESSLNCKVSYAKFAYNSYQTVFWPVVKWQCCARIDGCNSIRQGQQSFKATKAAEKHADHGCVDIWECTVYKVILVCIFCGICVCMSVYLSSLFCS
eukprot:364079_1